MKVQVGFRETERAMTLKILSVLGLFLWNCQADANSVPKRIIPLSPALGELVADCLGEDLERIVAVTQYTNYPPGLESRPKVGSYVQLNLEQIVSARPDLIIATRDGNPRDQIERLQELGFKVETIGTDSFSEIATTIRKVCHVVGSPQVGEALANRFEKGLRRIQERSRGKQKKKVFLQVGESPLVTVGKKTFLGEALESLGHQNIYSHSQLNYPRPSIEDILSKKPDRVVLLPMAQDLALVHKMKKRWEDLIQNGLFPDSAVRLITSDALLRPSLRLLEGMNQLEKALNDP